MVLMQENLENFFQIVQRKIDDIKTNGRDGVYSNEYRTMRHINSYKRLLDYDAEEIKNYLKSRKREVLGMCETVEDFVTVFKLHNYVKFTYERKWNREERKYYDMPDDADKMFLEAKEVLKKERLEKRKKKKAELV